MSEHEQVSSSSAATLAETESAQRPLIFQSNGLARGAVLLLLGALWLLSHGYSGLRHDARLYALQSLANLEPTAFADDLFLAFGSQDQFTLYTKLVAPLIPNIGLGAVTFGVSTIGALLWIVALCVLVQRFLAESSQRRLGIFFVLGFPGFYGAMQIFAVGRALATPRVLAEALVLVALTVWVGRYSPVGRNQPNRVGLWAGVVTSLLLAATLHPLMVIAGVLLIALDWVWADRRFLLAGIVCGGGVTILIGAALLGVSPFGRLLEVFDPAWLLVIEDRSEQLFLSGWEARDWSRLLVLATLTFGAIRILDGWRARWLGCVLVVALGGVIANGVGADVLNNVLLTQLQLFRLAWPLHVFGPLSAGVLLTFALLDWRKRQAPAALLGLALALACVGLSMGQTILAFVFACTGVAGLLVPRLSDALQRTWVHRLAWTMGIVMVGIDGFARVQDALSGSLTAEFRASAELVYAFDTPRVVFAVLLLPLLFARLRWVGRWGAVVLGLGLVTFGILFFDQRTPVAVAAERRTGLEQIADWIPPGQQVLWQREILYPWFVVRRPSYFADPQGAGVVFNRDTALEYKRRLGLIGHWGEDYSDLFDGPPRIADWVTRARAVCLDQGNLFGLALESRLQPREPAEVGGDGSISDDPSQSALAYREFSVPGGGEFYLYSCSDVLAQP